MKLISPTLSGAQLNNQTAWFFLSSNSNVHGAQWSSIYFNTGVLSGYYGITYDGCVADAYVSDELGTQDANGNYSNVVEDIDFVQYVPVVASGSM
jgi:hypothetical protein